MKLNGWQRIGILASVLWMVGAYFITMGRVQDADDAITVDIESTCIDNANAQHDDIAVTACIQQMEDSAVAQFPEEQEQAAIVALSPVPFAWGFAYLSLFLFGWVKRGFAGARGD